MYLSSHTFRGEYNVWPVFFPYHWLLRRWAKPLESWPSNHRVITSVRKGWTHRYGAPQKPLTLNIRRFGFFPISPPLPFSCSLICLSCLFGSEKPFSWKPRCSQYFVCLLQPLWSFAPAGLLPRLPWLLNVAITQPQELGFMVHIKQTKHNTTNTEPGDTYWPWMIRRTLSFVSTDCLLGQG